MRVSYWFQPVGLQFSTSRDIRFYQPSEIQSLSDRQGGQDWHKVYHDFLVDSPNLMNFNVRIFRTK